MIQSSEVVLDAQEFFFMCLQAAIVPSELEASPWSFGSKPLSCLIDVGRVDHLRHHGRFTTATGLSESAGVLLKLHCEKLSLKNTTSSRSIPAPQVKVLSHGTKTIADDPHVLNL